MANLPPMRFQTTPDTLDALYNARPVFVVLTADEARRFARTLDNVVRKLDFGRAQDVTDGEREILRVLRDRLETGGLEE